MHSSSQKEKTTSFSGTDHLEESCDSAPAETDLSVSESSEPTVFEPTNICRNKNIGIRDCYYLSRVSAISDLRDLLDVGIDTDLVVKEPDDSSLERECLFGLTDYDGNRVPFHQRDEVRVLRKEVEGPLAIAGTDGIRFALPDDSGCREYLHMKTGCVCHGQVFFARALTRSIT